MHVAIVGIVRQDIALQNIALFVRRERIEQRGPRSDIAPADIERQHERILGLLHHGIVDRLAAALGEFGLVDAHEVQIRLGGLIRGRAGLEDIRRELVQLGKITGRLEHEHAAVPVVVAGGDELHGKIERRLLDELRHRIGGPCAVAAPDVAVSGFWRVRDDSEGDQLVRLGE